jgi:hypothetical protein
MAAGTKASAPAWAGIYHQANGKYVTDGAPAAEERQTSSVIATGTWPVRQMLEVLDTTIQIVTAG